MRYLLELTLLFLLALLIGLRVQSGPSFAQSQPAALAQTSHDCGSAFFSSDAADSDGICHSSDSGCVKDCCLLLVSFQTHMASHKADIDFVHDSFGLTGTTPSRVDPPPIA